MISFGPSTPCAAFPDVNGRPFRIDKSPTWVMWPVFAWKVVVPEAKNRGLDVFQEHVLALCRAGVRSAKEIASRLELPEELVAAIVLQLQNEMGLLDPQAFPTRRADKLMADEEQLGEETIEEAGYVLEDALVGGLWPRFHRGNLPVVDARVEGGRAKFQVGPVGNPHSVSAPLLVPRPREGARPTAHEILRAARLHARRERAWARECAAGSLAAAELETEGSRRIDRVRLLGDTPEPVFLATYIFVPKGNDRSWLICDPCGLGVSSSLRDAAVRHVKSGRSDLERILHKLHQEANHVDEEDLALLFSTTLGAARARVEARLGPAAEILPVQVAQHLSQAEQRLGHARGTPTRAAKPLDDALRESFAAIECAFQWLVSLFPEPGLLASIAASPEANAQLLAAVAASLGFTKPREGASLLFTKRSVAEGALKNKNPALPGNLALALTAAQRHAEHPLRSLAEAFPDALGRLSRLKHWRDSSSHESANGPAVALVEEAVEEAFRLVGALVGKVPQPVAGAAPGQPAWGAELVLKLRAQAEVVVRGIEGAEDRPELRSRLIEVQQAALTLEALARATRVDSMDLAGPLGEFATAAGTVLEAALKELDLLAPLSRDGMKGLSPDDRKANAALLARAAKDLGFTLDPLGELPGVIGMARPDHIRRASEGRAEGLGAKLMAHLLCARTRPDHPLWEVARLRPSFLLGVSKVLYARGHAGTVPLRTADVPDLDMLVLDLVKTVVEATL